MRVSIKISPVALALVLIFTLVETAVLTIWLLLLGIPITTGLLMGTAAALMLFFGLLFEHLLAAISTKV